LRKVNRFPPGVYYTDDLVEYKGVVYRIREVIPKEGKAVLDLETLAVPVVKEAKEVAAVMIQYQRDPENIATLQDAGNVSYMAIVPLAELQLVELDHTPEAYERLRQYVQEKLLASGAIDEYHANPEIPDSIAAHIVADAWRQYDRKKYADMGIELAVKHPPSTIDDKHFSLRTFVKDKK